MANSDHYYIHKRPEIFPDYDFRRELIPPGVSEDYPDGVVGIRVDEDLWVVAELPWSFREKPIQQIVKELWPSVAAEAIYGPDISEHQEEYIS